MSLQRHSRLLEKTSRLFFLKKMVFPSLSRVSLENIDYYLRSSLLSLLSPPRLESTSSRGHLHLRTLMPGVYSKVQFHSFQAFCTIAGKCLERVLGQIFGFVISQIYKNLVHLIGTPKTLWPWLAIPRHKSIISFPLDPCVDSSAIQFLPFQLHPVSINHSTSIDGRQAQMSHSRVYDWRDRVFDRLGRLQCLD